MIWLRRAGIAIGAVLLAMGLAMLGAPARRREKAEEREIGYLSSQRKVHTEKARKQALKA